MTHDIVLNRRRLLLSATAITAIGLSGCGKTSAAPENVLRASVTGKGESDTRRLLQSAGIAPQGFDVHYADFQSGHLVIEAMNAGALDLGGMSEIPPIFALASSTQSFRQIAVLHGDVNNQAVLVPRSSGIARLEDLRGRRVGYVRATTSQYFLIRMLQSVGLTWADITPVALSVSDGGSAFTSGAIDAWAIYGFPIQRAVAIEGARILRTALGFLSGNYVVSAHVDALADPIKAMHIGEYLRMMRRGFAWAAAHQAAWAQIVARDIGVPLAYVQDEFRRKSASYSLRPVDQDAIASQQGVADLFVEQKLVPRRVDVRPLWDDRYNSILAEKV